MQNNPKGFYIGKPGELYGVLYDGELAFKKSISSNLFFKALTLFGFVLITFGFYLGSKFFLFNLNTFKRKHA